MTKTISVYMPRPLIKRLEQAMRDKVFTSESGFIVHVVRQYLEDEGYTGEITQ